jgi:hypothetical protein
MAPKAERVRRLGMRDYDAIGQTLTGIELEHVDFPGWIFRLDAQPGGRLTSFSIVGKPDEIPAGGVTKRLLVALPMDDVQRAARQAVEEYLGALPQFGVNMSAPLRAHLDDLAADFQRRRRPGRAKRGDVFYAALSAKYVALLGEPSPVKLLAQQENMTESGIRNILASARRRGVLTDAPPGRAGGDLTDYGKELLNGTR